MSAVSKVWRRVWNSLAIGSVKISDDTQTVLRSQVGVGPLEIQDNTPMLQHYGFSSVPPPGADCVLVYIGGDRSQGIGIASGNQLTRPKGKQPGETVIYNGAGMSVYLSNAGIVINSGGMPVTLNGDLRVTGEVTRGYGTAASATLGHHTHTSTTAGSQTSAPTPGT